MLKVQQLRYLAAVADTLSFSRAAERCGVTQPTLSMQLRALEDRLGAHLVERNRARVLLTPLGAEIAGRARRILAELDDIADVARLHGAGRAEGTVTLGVEPTVGAYVLSLAMPNLRQAFPGLAFSVREEPAERLSGKLADGSHDMLLLPERPALPGMVARPLIREPLHLVVPADHPLAAHATVDPAALAGETILTLQQGHRLNDPVAAFARATGAILAPDYTGTTLDMLRLMVAAGMGITLLPALYVRSDVQRETLIVSRPLAYDAPVREITMFWRASSPRQDVFATLADAIAGCLGPWGLE